MEFHPKEFLRAVPASSELLLPANNNNRAFNRVAHSALNKRNAFIIRYSRDRMQTGI